MIYIFWLSSIILITYIITRKRYVDLFTVATVCFFYYSFPAFIGKIDAANGVYVSEVHNGTYIVLITLIFSLLIGAILYDYKFQTTISYVKTPKYVIRLLCYFTIAVFLLNLLVIDISVFLDPDKTLISEEDTRFYNLSLWAGLICLVIGVNKKQIFPATIGSLIVLFSLYVGSRAYIMIAVLTLVVLLFRGKKLQIVKKPKFVLIGIFTIFILSVYKEVYKAIKDNDWNYLKETLFDSSFYQELDVFVEANAILSNLNVAIELGFNIELYKIFMNFINIFPFVFRYFNIFSGEQVTTYDFADIISNEFHPEISYGMGRNFWAEIYTYGGPITLFLFIVGWILLIILGNRMILNQSLLGIFILPAFLYSSFYIHRLDLSMITSSFKSNLIIFIIIYSCYLIFIKPYIKKEIKLRPKKVRSIKYKY